MKPFVKVMSHDNLGVPMKIVVQVFPHISTAEAILMFLGGASLGALCVGFELRKYTLVNKEETENEQN